MEQAPGKLDYLNPLKTLPSAFTALKEAVKIKNKSFWERVSIFWDSFKEEMGALNKEKEEVSSEARALIAKENSEVTDIVVDEINYHEQVEDNDQEFFRSNVIEPVLQNLGSDRFTEEQRGYIVDGLKKFKESSEGETPTQITEEQLSPTLAFSLMNLKKLKEQYPNSSDLKNHLDKIIEISANTDYPLEKLVTDRDILLRVLNLEDFSITELWKIRNLGFSLLGKFDLGTEVFKMVDPTLNEEDRESVLSILGKKLFPNTLENVQNAENLKTLYDHLYNTVSGKKGMNTQILAEIITIIDVRDFYLMIDRLLS
ncbi:hypothetical protein GF354_05365 [Candidatus Peregrinibacteria bacterium]|nr:hypothetical protein [Candidatus Peregrinibacteria bacterium]